MNPIPITTIILLKRDQDRVMNVQNNCLPYLKSFRIQEALDWQDSEKIINYKLEHDIKIDRNYLHKSKFVSLGKFGCSFSHMQAWKYQIDNDINHMIILEDDAILNDNFTQITNDIISELPDNFDFVYLYIHPEQFIDPDDSRITIPGKKFINKGYRTWCRLAYILSLKGAKKLWSLFKNGIYNSGDMMIIDQVKAKTLETFSTKIPYVRCAGQAVPDDKDSNKLKSNIWSSPVPSSTVLKKLS